MRWGFAGFDGKPLINGRAMYYTNNEIEQCAENILHDFTGGLTGAAADIRPLNVEVFARHYLGLRLIYTRLSDDGSVLGVTAYGDADIELRRNLVKSTVSVARNTILIDERLFSSNHGRRRFTIAHECAHHILWRMENFRAPNVPRPMYSFSLAAPAKTAEERITNALAAALLMPMKYVRLLVTRFAGGQKLVSYGGRFNMPDELSLSNICHALGVSRAAAALRLRQLGYLADAPREEFYDPLEIYVDE
jgi:Zn-dependent peptidase ImmA (M78 family)